MKSNAVKDALIERFKLMDRYDAKLREDARRALDEKARIASGKDGTDQRRV